MTADRPLDDGWRSSGRVFLRSPIPLWGAFVLAHLWLGILNLYAPGLPLGDVTIVYKFWTDQALQANYWVGIDSSWVYPILAMVPMLIARVFGPALYASTWLSMVMVLDAVALAAIIGWGRRRQNAAIGWWWVAFLVLLGPIALGRIDSITVPLAIVGVLFIATRPVVASVILTIATWIKVWPAAIVVAIVIAAKARRRVVIAAVVVSAVIVLFALLYGAGANVFSFVTQQTGRGLQVESPVSTIWLWRAFAGDQNTFVYYDQGILTWQVKGPGVDLASAVMNPLLGLAAVTIAVLAIVAVRRRAGVADVLPSLVLAFVAAFIAFNKVGSPQYVTWLAVPVILGLATNAAGFGRSFRVPAVIVAALAGLTQLIYPYLYGYLLGLNGPMLVVISVRNLLFFVLLGWAVAGLWRAARPVRVREHIVDEPAWLPTVWPFGLADGAQPQEGAERGRLGTEEPVS